MASFYVCLIYDSYNEETGFYIQHQECVPWDEEFFGPWEGAQYESLEDCQNNSICQGGTSGQDPGYDSNNYCSIGFSSINLLFIGDSSISLELNFEEEYENTYIEYLLFDSNNVLLTDDIIRLEGTPNPLPLNLTINIPMVTGACAIHIRLIRLCDALEEASGSLESSSGSDSGSDSGSGEGQEILSQQLFDESSWLGLDQEASISIEYYLNEAAAAWNTIIRYSDSVFYGYKDINPSWNGLALVNYEEINDPDGWIAACGPVLGIDILDNDPQNIKQNALTFQLFINTAFNEAPWNFTDSDWINTIAHELGHALGIGIYWQEYNDFWLQGSKYSNTQLAYNELIGDNSNNRTLIPLEDSGGIGTESAHWEDNGRLISYPNSDGYTHPGCDFDIMVGYYEMGNPLPISNLSKQLLIDIGYQDTGVDTFITPQLNIIVPSGNLNIRANTYIDKNTRCGTAHKCGCNTRQIIGVLDINTHSFHEH